MTTEPLTKPVVESTNANTTRQNIRGSSLLLGGQFISKVTNFGVQVAIVRGLTRDDFGAFAYAMALVEIFQVIAMFGMARALPRFLPIYQEEGRTDRVYGALAVSAICVLVASVVVVVGIQLTAPLLVGTLIKSQQSMDCLLVLIFIAPLLAIDRVLIALMAQFGAAKKIFVRRHLLNPALKVVAIVPVLIAGGSIQHLCLAYAGAIVVGTALTAFLLGPIMRAEGISPAIHRQQIELPFREMMAFSLPLLTSELLVIVIGTMDAIMLEQLRGTSEVAGLRAVFKIAILNQLVSHSFTLLYLPSVSRAFAKKDKTAINAGYWQTAVWIAVLTFPVFALTCMGAKSVVSTFYDARYSDAPILLMLLTLGVYADSMLGFNILTLKVYGRMRWVLLMNAITAVFAVCINLLLIPPYGATGAAVGTLLTMLLLLAMKHVAMWRLTDVSLFSRKFLFVYGMIVLLSIVVAGFNIVLDPPLWANILVVGLLTIALLVASRGAMQIDSTFPELRRIPILGPLFARTSS